MDKDITSFLLNLLQTKGSDLQYGNENVTQLEHALQCAELTEKNNCSKEIITAALLHDIGHLLYDGKDPIHKGKDGHHENLGADYLSKYFGEQTAVKTYNLYGKNVEKGGGIFPNVAFCQVNFTQENTLLKNCGKNATTFIESIEHCLNSPLS